MTGSELKSVLDAERSGAPFLTWRGTDGQLRMLSLAGRDALTIGRRSSSDVALTGDGEASRLHARLERFGDDWVILDGGLSRKGTFVDDERVGRKMRLEDGNKILAGQTIVHFRNPAQGDTAITQASDGGLRPTDLTATQRRILVALCRPLAESNGYAAPASNRQIAAEIFLGKDSVKGNLRELYKRFDIDLPQNQKRAALAARALRMGLGGS